MTVHVTIMNCKLLNFSDYQVIKFALLIICIM